MIELTAESVADAMLSCYNHFNRKVGIAFTSHKKMYDFAMSLHRQQREGLVPATHYKRGVDEIFFDTGSSIRMVNAGDPKNLYGLRFNTVLYDPEISEKEVLAHLESCEICHSSVQFKNGEYIRVNPEMEIDTQPLDDFLNGFPVIKS